jgi:hypothetical protein
VTNQPIDPTTTAHATRSRKAGYTGDGGLSRSIIGAQMRLTSEQGTVFVEGMIHLVHAWGAGV